MILPCVTFGYFFNLKKSLRGRAHSKDETDKAIRAYFYLHQEMDNLMHLIFGKFLYNSALILQGTTLNTRKI